MRVSGVRSSCDASATNRRWRRRRRLEPGEHLVHGPASRSISSPVPGSGTRWSSSASPIAATSRGSPRRVARCDRPATTPSTASTSTAIGKATAMRARPAPARRRGDHRCSRRPRRTASRRRRRTGGSAPGTRRPRAGDPNGSVPLGDRPVGPPAPRRPATLSDANSTRPPASSTWAKRSSRLELAIAAVGVDQHRRLDLIGALFERPVEVLTQLGLSDQHHDHRCDGQHDEADHRRDRGDPRADRSPAHDAGPSSTIR